MPDGIGQRVIGSMYCELPEGHRTTLVVGMCDMLEVAALYVPPWHKRRFGAVIGYERLVESGPLRQQFDKYMSEDVARMNYQAASCFFTALNQWSGFK